MITLPSPIAASDITHYIAQMVAQINAEIAAFGDGMSQLDGLRVAVDGMRSRLSQVEARLSALEGGLKGLAGRTDKIETAMVDPPSAPTAKEAAAAAKVEAKNG